MKMKKLFVLFLNMAMLLPLAACGGTSSGTEPAASDTDAEPARTLSAEEEQMLARYKEWSLEGSPEGVSSFLEAEFRLQAYRYQDTADATLENVKDFQSALRRLTEIAQELLKD